MVTRAFRPSEETTARRGRLRSFLASAALVLVSFVVGYLLLELAFFRILLPAFHFNIRPYLPETAGVMVQSSKARFVPSRYLAILGDSYAEGIGDWLLSVADNEAKAFHTAHVIHARLGIDVVTFGKGGISSAEALVRQPAHIMEGRRCAIFPNFDEPRWILAYFYEGNDIQDNLAFLRKVAAEYGNDNAASIDRYLSENYASYGSWRCELYLGDVISRMVRFLKIYYLRGITMSPRPPGGNAFLIDGAAFDAPAPLEGPALEIGEEGLKKGALVFERSLSWLRGRFAGVPISVVYIPAPLSAYRLMGASYKHVVEPADDGKWAIAGADAIARHSDEICNMVRGAALRHGSGFISATPALRRAALSRPIHGPVDWSHLNRYGYETLGELLAGRIDEDAPADACQ